MKGAAPPVGEGVQEVGQLVEDGIQEDVLQAGSEEAVGDGDPVGAAPGHVAPVGGGHAPGDP